MAPDVLIRRYFALLVLGAVALCAWLSARGVSALLDARLAAKAAASARPGAAPTAAADQERSGAPILARNPFDSVTGPLDKPDAAASAAPSAPLATEPLTAPPCPDLEVRIVTEADDPRASRAALLAKGDPMARMYGVGDRVGERTVAYIGFNPARRTPAVWLAGDTGLCQALLFDTGDAAPAPVAVPQSPPAPADVDDLARSIHAHGSDVIIDRSAVDAVLSDGRRLMPDSAILFEQADGKVLGVRVFRIDPDSLLAHLGIHSGDRIESVGGVHVSSRDNALQGWQALRGSDPVEVQLLRAGKPLTIQVQAR